MRNALARHFAKAIRASLCLPLRLPEYVPVWDQKWEVVDALSASQKQRARSAEGHAVGALSAAKPMRDSSSSTAQMVPVRSVAHRAYAKEESDSEDDVLLSNLAFTDRLIG